MGFRATLNFRKFKFPNIPVSLESELHDDINRRASSNQIFHTLISN